jgi:hypothetical protein
MSSNNNSKFLDILNTTARAGEGDNWESRFSHFDEKLKRQVAVTAALELINANVGNGSIKDHMNNLSRYADQILNAMKVNDN